MTKIMEYCYGCGKDTETLEIAGGDCKECGFSKVTPKMLCSFCGSPQEKVRNLIAAGPNYAEHKGDKGHPVYICNECVDLCQEIINEPMTDAMNKWLGNNGNDDNEWAFKRGWQYLGTDDDEEDPDFNQFDMPYDFEAGIKAKRKYLEGLKNEKNVSRM